MYIADEYPRYKTKSSKPFDPIEVTKRTEEIVLRKEDNTYSRKYTTFYAAGVYRGIVTGCAVGCNLRCIFCWVPFSRDFPEIYGDFYSPKEVYRKIEEIARDYKISKARISCGEPTIGKEHLLEVLEYIERSEIIKLFILETNGIIFGIDEDFVRALKKFSKVYVRISLKAGTPEQFSYKTGAKPEFFDLPFRAIKFLIKYKIPFHVAAMSADPRIVTIEERIALLKRLLEIDKKLVYQLEEEVIDPYDSSLKRLEYAGVKLEWPLRRIYSHLSTLLKKLREGNDE